jgi:hypothetical protein
MTIEGASPASSTLPSHMVSLSGEDWSAWRWVVLRGAGFPADLVLTLAAPEAAAVADTLMRAEDEEHRTRRAALDAHHRALAHAAADRATLNKIKKQIVKGRAVDAASIADPSVRAAVEAHNDAVARARMVRDAYARAYAAADEALDCTIYDLTASSSFCEALIWQNRGAYRRVIAPLREAATSRPAIGANDRRLVASYLQRYCVKNDTIGFFGPVGWIRLSPDRTSLTARPGAHLLAARSVFFETWCIDAVCNALSRDESLLHWIEPRPGYVRLDSRLMRTYGLGRRAPTQLDATQMAVLLECDGERTAERVVQDLVASQPSLFPDEASVYEQLSTLRQSGAIAWKLSVPMGSRPELDLRQQLQQVRDDRLQQDALAVVAELEQARARVSAAAGNPDALDAALDRLDHTFTRVTGEAPTRKAGQIYAGRTLVFEDCRRDLDVEIGADVLEELGRPLSLLLTSARWLSGELVRRYRETLAITHAELAARSGSPAVDAATFWQSIQPIMKVTDNPLIDQIADTFGQRWRAILAPMIAQQRDDGGEPRRVQLRSDDVRERVEQAFGARRPGWEQARYHSPDVMIAADGPDAIGRGDYSFVLGEFHIAKNTLDSTTFVDQHPSPHEIAAALAADLRQPRVIIPRLRARGYRGCDLPTDYWLETEIRSGCPRSHVLPLTGLTVERHGDVVIVRTLDGRVSFDLIDFFGRDIAFIIVNAFKKMLDGTRHYPRLTIDRLVVQRERWSVPAADLAWAGEKDDAARFLAARRWVRERRMPRFVFVKAIVEAKPYYVDFDSPVYVSILAKSVLRTLEQHPAGAEIALTEMLPAHDQMWVPDDAGRRYASELRIAVYDRADGRVTPDLDRAVGAVSTTVEREPSGERPTLG